MSAFCSCRRQTMPVENEMSNPGYVISGYQVRLIVVKHTANETKIKRQAAR